MEKITLKEFWDMADKGVKAAIHCDTEEKANKLCAEFDKLGKRWSTDRSYKVDNNWEFYKDKTCYRNDCTFSLKSFYISSGLKVYEFEDIIFDSDKTTDYPKIAQIRMTNGKNYYYALYDENIKRRSFVLVTGKAAEKILEVMAVYGTDNRPKDCPENLTQEVIGEIDMKPYRARVKARRKKKQEEINTLTKEISKCREKLLQDFLNQNEEYKTLTIQLEKLKNG